MLVMDFDRDKIALSYTGKRMPEIMAKIPTFRRDGKGGCEWNGVEVRKVRSGIVGQVRVLRRAPSGELVVWGLIDRTPTHAIYERMKAPTCADLTNGTSWGPKYGAVQ